MEVPHVIHLVSSHSSPTGYTAPLSSHPLRSHHYGHRLHLRRTHPVLISTVPTTPPDVPHLPHRKHLLDLSTNSKKRRAAPKNQPKAGGQETPAAKDDKDGGKSEVPSAQPSRLLRELGIRVSRYTYEERRDIILRYMQKRSGRQGVNRAATKVPSRQALAERRRRGAGGKFLGKENAQTADKPEEKAEEEPELPPEVIANAGGVPIVGMVF